MSKDITDERYTPYIIPPKKEYGYIESQIVKSYHNLILAINTYLIFSTTPPDIQIVKSLVR